MLDPFVCPNLPQKSAESQSDRETRTQIAHLAGVSHDTVAKVKKINKKARPELKKKLQAGEVSINEAYKAIRAEEKAEIAPFYDCAK